MRTTAPAQRSPASGAPPAARRGRAAPQSPPQPEVQASPTLAAPPVAPVSGAVAVATVRVVRVDEGLHALHIGALAGNAGAVAGMAVPMALVCAPPGADGNEVEIAASFPGRGPWFGKDGGTAILRSPPGGGSIIVTLYGGPGGSPGQGAADLALDLRRLDRPRAGAAAPAAGVAAAVAATAGVSSAALTSTRDVSTEILLHIERAGDRLFPGRGWVGALGRRMRIEAFSIRPLERLGPADIEMKAFLPNGGETQWVPGGVLCGTRGRGLPLVGFAVRVAPQHAERFDVVYQGSFFAGGISEPQQHGDACRSATADDPLEAVNVRLFERVADPQGADPQGADPQEADPAGNDSAG